MKQQLRNIGVLAALCLLASNSGLADPRYQGPFETAPSGHNRPTAKVYLPNQYAERQAWPLVLILHGYSGHGESTDAHFGLSPKVSERGFILAVPQGTTDIKGDTFWNATDSCCNFYNSQVDDVGYLVALIRKIQSERRVDPRRIYVIGHSNGGFMINRLACETQGLFAGMASLAGVGYKNPALCRVKAPISMLHIHAVDDPTVLYDGDEDYPGAEASFQQWLERDGCQGAGRPGPTLKLTASIPGLDTTTQYWRKCRENTVLALWKIKAYKSSKHEPHSPEFSAEFTDLLLDFLFEQHL